MIEMAKGKHVFGLTIKNVPSQHHELYVTFFIR